jgi:exopolysaccharide biosynthesis polyprenyl glycosylphosphotransferase
VLDALILSLAWYLFYTSEQSILDSYLSSSDFSLLSLGSLHVIFWILVFIFMGLYKKIYLASRFDEFVKVVKATITGTLILYFVITIDSRFAFQDVITTTIVYMGLLGGLMIINRFTIRTIQKIYAQQGRGLHRAIIVGTGKMAQMAYEDLLRNKTMGMEVFGFVHVNGIHPEPPVAVAESDILCELNDINDILQKLEIQDIIVALEPDRRRDLVQVISKVDHPDITLKLLPDFYELVGGLNKTNQIFGLPLIEITPSPMPAWEKITKRLMDLVISTVVLIVASPVMATIAVAIRSTSDGPVIYRQRRVGRKGKVFTMLKFRTMKNNAEAESGPTWATEDDPRVTKVGGWLRKLRLDELPQFWNVLRGDMSLVGPRPERPYFVEQFHKEIPLYSRRHRVRPGITGWAQVKWKYDASLDDVREKTKYDLFYVENMSLRIDFKILINTFFTVIRAKGQ